ncbi:triose-phosphate isomerase [Thalassotalea aquiviva]|uniref:triose-phosphate isomerase n=1 Tax=Thalassotalea aquiviva TaxID=3242415 RepID=UPI00352AAE73
MKRQTIIAANWKMNGNLALVKEISAGLNGENFGDNQVIISTPAPYMAAMNAVIDNANVACGAQNINENESGAFTGELSALMLNDLNVQYVILGHSERRSIYGESDELIAAKVETALNHGLTPLFCIGETLEERESGRTNEVLASQMAPVIEKVGIEKFADIIVAYEPVWAIGTGKTASAAMAQETHEFIRSYLAEQDADVAQKVPLLYGGSVNAETAKELFSQADIDGGLVGGASLKVEEFKKICLAV